MPNPPDAVTGVKVVSNVPAVPVVVATACVVESADGLTVSWNVLDEVCAVGVALSVTVSVKVVAERSVEGVPEIAPVVVEKDNPVGRVPPEIA